MRRILLATDMKPSADQALKRACRMAAEGGGELRILFVPPETMSDHGRAVARGMIDERSRACAEAAAKLDLSVRMPVGKEPEEAILDEARRFCPELIVLGSHGDPRLRDAIFGTTAWHVVRESDEPVLVVQNDGERAYRRVMAAVEEESAEAVLRLAASLAPDADIYAVHAFGSVGQSLFGLGETIEDVRTDQQALLRKIKAELAPAGSKSQIAFHNIVREGDAVDVIMRAWSEVEPDLLVMGTHGRSGLGLLLHESVAQAALLGCPSDLLVKRVGTRVAS
jgi:nucleotide-binding universal stress UspA family protein